MNKETILLIFGGSILVAVFALLFIKLFMGSDIESIEAAMLIAFALIIGYYFGSSQGSKDKDKK
jgi:carbon starvation protein CstA